jgi:hypothetical protein
MADTTKDRLRAARSNVSPTKRTAGEGNAGAGGVLPVERKIRITVDLPESMHRALKVRIANEGIDAQTFIRSLLKTALDRS